MSDGLDIGTLSGRVELEDHMSSSIDLLGHKIEELDEKFGGLGHHFVETAASFFTAEAALDAVKEAAHLAAETLKEITIEGSHAADIEDTFHHLTEGAGELGDVLLSKTREGLKGTVTDMDIMTRVNQNLAAGLKLSESQMVTMSQGALALAKATGGSTAEALDKMSAAMVTGRTRGIAMLTGKIDMAAAEERYADKLGVTTDHLTEQGKRMAIQEAILDKVAAATDRVGEPTIRLADKIEQVKVSFANFEEEVGTAIATSPVVAAGFDGIRDAIGEAFGNDKEHLIKTIATTVDNVAISVLGFAEHVVDAVGIIGQEWHAAIVVFDMVKAGWAGIAYVAEGALLLIEKGINAVSFGSMDEQVKSLEADMEGWYTSMAQSQQGINEHKQAEEDWAVTTGKVKDTIEGVRQKMIEAQAAEGDYSEVVRDSKKAHGEAGAAAEAHGKSEEVLANTMVMTKEEAKKFDAAWKELDATGTSWEMTLASINPELVKTIQYYISAGASVDQLAAAFPELTKNQIAAINKTLELAKAEADAANTLSKLYSEYYNQRAQLYGTDSEKATAAADKDYTIRVEELQKKGVKDVQYYDELWDLRNKDVQLADDARLLQDTNSKASLDKKITDAKDYLTFMRENYGQYTDADRQAQDKVVKNLQNTRDHWNEVGHSVDGVKDRVVIMDGEWVTDGDIAEATINKTTVMVKTLSGELISLAEAEKRQHMGGSYDITSQNFDQVVRSNTGIQDVNAAYNMAKQGYSFQEILTIMQRQKNGATGPAPPPQGPRIPGFRDGGVGDFGDGTLTMLHGKEAIVPLKDGIGGLGGTINNYIYVNDTLANAARSVSAEIMRTLKSQTKFGSA